MFFLALPDIAIEDRLMAQMQRGDQSALRQVYSAYFDSLYQFVRPRVNDQLEAEDIVSEVFLKLVQAFRTKRLPRQSLRGWLFRVARNQLCDHYHRVGDKRIVQFECDDDPPIEMDWDTASMEDEAIRQLDIGTIMEAVQHLTPDQQDVIMLRYGQMLSLKDTAELMGRNINAIKVLQYRAIQALRRLLAPEKVGYHERV